MEILYYRVMHNRDRYTDVLQMSFEEFNRSISEIWVYDNYISKEGDSEQVSIILSIAAGGNYIKAERIRKIFFV